MGNLPMMTESGSFIINGAERVVVSQLHRSPGVFFSHDKGKAHASGKLLYSVRVIPYRGSWLDFEFDVKNKIFARIDRKRKFPATVILQALGCSQEQILETFFDFNRLSFRDNKIILHVDYDKLRGVAAFDDIYDNQNNKIVGKGVRINARHIAAIKKSDIKEMVIPSDYLVGKTLAKSVFNEDTGEVLFDCNHLLDLNDVNVLLESGIESVEILYINDIDCGPFMSLTMRDSNCASQFAAMAEIYSIIRPGEPPNKESVATLFENLFFNSETYELSEVGRIKLDSRLHRSKPSGSGILNKQDIVDILLRLINVRNGHENVDDIDHLGNRRVRGVGEMVEKQMRIALSRVNRAVYDRLSAHTFDGVLSPKDLISTKAISAVINEFFGSGQLSQFMDQVNPLAEITHKRRVSALGPGGLVKERAGFEVRDVHSSHYGRLCPIETPEGPNIGLINSLAAYSRVNKHGFLESPYYVVNNGVVSNKISYLSAIEEDNALIARSYSGLDKNDSIEVDARSRGEFVSRKIDEVNYMDVSPSQSVSVAASLIPFLEHDDANRALMGSNMQRQAVPLLRSSRPLVGTGMESVVARDSGVCVVAKRSGLVKVVDSSKILILSDVEDNTEDMIDSYHLIKFGKSNQNTVLHNKPIVNVGDRVEAGDVIADGASIDRGELALGQNLRVAFMPWRGYNFEDSILLSEKLVQDDLFSSVHVKELVCVVRDTKIGAEEVSADIPGVNENALDKLDDSGIVSLGSQVGTGDILVGKVSPKAEVQLTPEEKLLYAIFGEKAADIKDTSLRVPLGINGRVIDVKIYSRGDIEKNSRAISIEKEAIQSITSESEARISLLMEILLSSLLERSVGQDLVANKEKATRSKLQKLSLAEWNKMRFVNDDINRQNELDIKKFNDTRKKIGQKLLADKESIQSCDNNLAPGVRQVVKVYVAVKREIQPGDKLAGRHGNKGVVSSIKPIEDMPYDEEGNTIDVVLNPLGVPSRMNVGQILEVHLGAAAKGLGIKINKMLQDQARVEELRDFIGGVYGDSAIAKKIKKLSNSKLINIARELSQGVPMSTPVFNGVSEEKIKSTLQLADIPESGQITLYDGCTGEKFMRPVTVGYMYILKLNHLADDKMHARSTGSYSLVTQQPLGGKAQFGGQRFGEMEVWALEAYGASYTLQEILTIKSDDIEGRKLTYKEIVDTGTCTMQPGIPESFNVLTKELRALGIDVNIENT